MPYAHRVDNSLVGLCECGCGQQTTRARQAEGPYKAGEYRRFVRGHYRRAWACQRYKEAPKQKGGRRIQVHRLRAEQALGKPLPAGAVVHHADGSKDADAPLVICPDEAYHRQLHVRMRVRDAGGNPFTDRICSKCRAVKPLWAFHKDRHDYAGRMKYCAECRK